MKFSMKSKCRHLLSVMLIVLCISCEDDKSKIDTPSQPYDPSKPVLVSDFLPKEGGAYQKMVIYGENFGNDSSLVNVTIGGGKKRQLLSMCKAITCTFLFLPVLFQEK